MTKQRARRTPSALALLIAAGMGPSLAPGLAPGALAAQPKETASVPVGDYEPAESLEGNFLSAYIAGAARDTTAAATFYREAVRADPRNAELVERAFISLLADGALPDAFRTAEKLVARDPTNGLANLSLGVRQIKAGQWAAARQNFSRSGRGAATDLTATLLTAWSYAGAGDGKKALDTVAKLRGERYYNTFRDYHAGLIASVTGDNAEAERRLKAAYDADHNTLRIVDAYARMEASLDRTDLAIQAYSDFDQLSPRHPLVRDALEKLKEGKPLTRLIGTAQEGAAEVLYGLGSAGSTQGDELPAVIYLRLALYLAPDHALARLTLADTLDRMKQPERANEAYAQIPANSPLKLNADIQIGLNLEQMGKGDEALAHLDDVAAAAEGRARAGHDHDADRRVGAAALQGRRPGLDHREGEGVLPLGPVQRDGRDPLGDGEQQVLARVAGPSLGTHRAASRGAGWVSPGASIRAAISTGSSPASARTSAVCSPCRGAWRRIAKRLPLNEAGRRMVR